MSKRFSGKVCVITGSTQGIGFAIAERLLREGGKVVVSSRKPDNVAAAVKTLQKIATDPGDVAGCVCHVSKEDHRKRLLETAQERFRSPIDVLVLNAASNTHFGDSLSTSLKAFDTMLETNVKSSFALAKESVPFLRTAANVARSDESSSTPAPLFPPSMFSTNVLIVSSIAGYCPASPIGMYGVSKTALFGLTKALAVDFSALGVRVNCVAPGIIRTNFSTVLVDAFEAANDKQTKGTTNEEADLSMPKELTSSLMKRVGEPSEVAAVSAFLCSADASFITGEVVVASGGTSCRL